jgi:hypothetical protein
MYHMHEESKCAGCKSPARMAVGCPFITCAVKKRSVEFCWQCSESDSCEKWKKHREASREHDSFKCYQKLEDDISFIFEHGIEEYERQQKIRDQYLTEMLNEYNDGRSKSYYCIAATVLRIDELKVVMDTAKKKTKDMQLKQKARVLHSMLNLIAIEKCYLLKLRK